MNNKLQEELVNALQVGPGGVHLLLLVDTSLSHAQVGLLDVWQRPKDILFNHVEDLVQVWNDDRRHVLLVLEDGLQLLDGVESLSLKYNKIGWAAITLALTSLVSSL